MEPDIPPHAVAEALHRSIACDWNMEEYMDFSLVANAQLHRSRMILGIVLGSILIIFAIVVNPRTVIPPQSVILTVALVMLMLPVIDRLKLKAQVERVFKAPTQFLAAKRSISLGDKGLTMASQDGSFTFVPWTSVVSVKEGKLGIYFLVTASSGFIAARRAFPDNESYTAFAEFAKARQSNKKVTGA